MPICAQTVTWGFCPEGVRALRGSRPTWVPGPLRSMGGDKWGNENKWKQKKKKRPGVVKERKERKRGNMESGVRRGRRMAT